MNQEMPEKYEDRLHQCAEHLRLKTGSFSAPEVHKEMTDREWLSPLDSVLDTHKLLTEMYGKPGE